MSGGLLKRLRDLREGASRLPHEASILAHLALLLNTRQGSSELDPRYGIPDLTDAAHSLPGSVPVLQRTIAEAIQRYEPRLRAVSVQPRQLLPHAMTLSFEVRAQLVTGGTMAFETTLARGGQITVK